MNGAPDLFEDQRYAWGGINPLLLQLQDNLAQGKHVAPATHADRADALIGSR